MNNYQPRQRRDREYEFTLYMNKNIIVQRYFHVLGYNPKAIYSLDWKDAVDTNMEIIQEYMKNKTLDFMEMNSALFYDNPDFLSNKGRDKDVMRIVVRKGEQILATREWDASVYIRHIDAGKVDVREYIYDMITRLQRCLSESTENLEMTYQEYNLDMSEHGF